MLDPSHLWLTIHESVGHPTELDRVLGYEANYAGTSFATLDKWKREVQVRPDQVNIFADKTQPGSLGAVGYDDEGVKTQALGHHQGRHPGQLPGHRDQAHIIGEKESHGCCYADTWSSVQFQRMPNVSLAPGKAKLTPADMIKDVKNGIYIVGDGSFSIDQQRYNFQFGGQLFYEIKNGKITGQIEDVAYQSNTQEFWNACVAVCDERDYRMGGSFFDGKGQPGQVSAVSHGSSTTRFNGINVINTARSLGDQAGSRDRGFEIRESALMRSRRSHNQVWRTPMSIYTEEQAKAILDKVIKLSKADECSATLSGSSGGNIRFARNSVSTTGHVSDADLAVEVAFGKRVGTATINEFDDTSLEAVVRRAEELARLAPENPEFMPAVDKQDYKASGTFNPTTATITPEYRAAGRRRLHRAVPQEQAGRGRLLQRRHTLLRDRQLQGQVRLPAVGRDGLHLHRAHRRRPRLGLGHAQPRRRRQVRRARARSRRPSRRPCARSMPRRWSRATTP